MATVANTDRSFCHALGQDDASSVDQRFPAIATGDVALETQPPAEDAHHPRTDLGQNGLIAAHRRRIVATQMLLLLENALRIAQPLFLGWAINDLISHTSSGLMALIVQHLAYMLVTSLRQMYETRAINELSSLAETHVLKESRGHGAQMLSPSLTELRESVSLLEHVIPFVMYIAFSTLGAMLMLGWYDMTLVPLCLVLLVPACLLNAAYGRKSSLLSDRLRSEQKREPAVIGEGKTRDVRRHFEALAQWRIKLSDSETTNFCLMELFVLGVVATVLVHYCVNRTPQAGDIFAVLQYVLLFVTGLRGIPVAVGQLMRLAERSVASPNVL